MIEVYSAHNVGAGVQVIPGPNLKVKITVEWDDAMCVPAPRPRAGTMAIPRSIQRASRPFADLHINHVGGSFLARVRKSRNHWSMPTALLAVWEPQGPVNEEVMQKCVSFVGNVFERVHMLMEL